METIVYTKNELKEALSSKSFPIIIKGEYAKEIKKKYKARKRIKKGALIGGVTTAVAGLVAMPFTGGASGAVSAMGVTNAISAMGMTATGLAIGTATIPVAELCVLCGFTLGLIGLFQGRKVKVRFGPAEVEITEKV